MGLASGRAIKAATLKFKNDPTTCAAGNPYRKYANNFRNKRGLSNIPVGSPCNKSGQRILPTTSLGPKAYRFKRFIFGPRNPNDAYGQLRDHVVTFSRISSNPNWFFTATFNIGVVSEYYPDPGPSTHGRQDIKIFYILKDKSGSNDIEISQNDNPWFIKAGYTALDALTYSRVGPFNPSPVLLRNTGVAATSTDPSVDFKEVRWDLVADIEWLGT